VSLLVGGLLIGKAAIFDIFTNLRRSAQVGRMPQLQDTNKVLSATDWRSEHGELRDGNWKAPTENAAFSADCLHAPREHRPPWISFWSSIEHARCVNLLDLECREVGPQQPPTPNAAHVTRAPAGLGTNRVPTDCLLKRLGGKC
jgi:hypothetical protein